MARNSRGRQRVWSSEQEPLSFLWPWIAVPYYPHEAVPSKLYRLERIWSMSGNYAAVIDALYIVNAAGVQCPDWAAEAARRAIAAPEPVARWKVKRQKDLIDVVRASTFLEARYDSENGRALLSRDQAAEFTVEWLRGSSAATTIDGLKRLLSRMRANEKRAFGRYYLAGGSLWWRKKYFPGPTAADRRRLHRGWHQQKTARQKPGRLSSK